MYFKALFILCFAVKCSDLGAVCKKIRRTIKRSAAQKLLLCIVVCLLIKKSEESIMNIQEFKEFKFKAFGFSCE